MCERAEEPVSAGFMVSEHFHPWTPQQGQAAFAWSFMGALGSHTSLPFGSAVTCPGFRYHPAVIAHAAATLGAMFPGRFWLGLGAGEALNEHILGGEWPEIGVRSAMLFEAIEVISNLFTGTSSSPRDHFRLESAIFYTRPEQPVPVYVATAGPLTPGRPPARRRMIRSRGDEKIGMLWERFDEGAREGARPRRNARLHQVHVQLALTDEEATEIASASGPTAGWLTIRTQNPEDYAAMARMVRPGLPEPSPQLVRPGRPRRHKSALLDMGFDEVHLHNVGRNRPSSRRVRRRGAAGAAPGRLSERREQGRTHGQDARVDSSSSRRIVGLATAHGSSRRARPAPPAPREGGGAGRPQTGPNSGYPSRTPTTGVGEARHVRGWRRDALAFADEHAIPTSCAGSSSWPPRWRAARLAAIAERARANGVPSASRGRRDARGRARFGPARPARPLDRHNDWGRVTLALADDSCPGRRDRTSASRPGPPDDRRWSWRRGRAPRPPATSTPAAASTPTGRRLRRGSPETPDRPLPGELRHPPPGGPRFFGRSSTLSPTRAFPFLAVHLTGGSTAMLAGPNAVLAFGREAYRDRHRLGELGRICVPRLRPPRPPQRAHGGAEMIRRPHPATLPAARSASPRAGMTDLAWDRRESGPRRCAASEPGRGFAITGGAHVLHVQNAPSPAATAGLAIGRELATKAIAQFGI